jgi:hypothetical protein
MTDRRLFPSHIMNRWIDRRRQFVVLSSGMSALVVALCVACRAEESVWLRRRGFDQLREGRATDGGQNLYVSRRGRLQTINRLDLNTDGEIDLLFTQDHNSVYAPDSLIYWGGPHGFHSLLPELNELRAGFSLLTWLDRAAGRITRLPTWGGGRAAVADLNGDEFQDIVVANFMHNYRQDQAALIYWGGEAGFSEQNRGELPAWLASGVAIADLNRDGFPDVVVSNRGDERGESWGFRLNLESYVYWGSANGFSPGRRLSLPTISAADVTTGDYNGDGHIDLAFVNFNRDEQSLFVYFNDGGGGFDKQRRQELSRADLQLTKFGKDSSGRNHGMQALRTATLNDDPYADLIVAGTDKAVVYHGGSRGLQIEGASSFPVENCQGIAVADLNNDRLPEIVFANQGLNSGGRDVKSRPSSTIYWSSANGYDRQRRSDLPTLGATTAQVADLNGDGLLDLLFGNRGDGASQDVPSYIYWGGEDGFSKFRRQELSGFGTVGSGVADFNHDGWPDVLLVSHLSGNTGPRPAAVYWGNESHDYGIASHTQLDVNPRMEHSVSDLDDDGFPDIVFLSGPAGQSMVMWGSPEGYDSGRRTDLPVEKPNSSSVADLNMDGHLDILLVIPERRGTRTQLQASIVWGDGQRFSTARTAEFEVAEGGNEANTIADLNRDGFLDLIFAVTNSPFSEIWYGGPDGYAREQTERLRANGSPHAVAADLDADGWLDLIFTSGADVKRFTFHTPTLIHWGGPDGFRAQAPTELESYTALDATVADLNRDSHLDIAITNYRSDVGRMVPTFLYWGDGTRDFGTHRRTMLKTASGSAVDSLDLNRDGWLELIVSNHQENFDHAAAGTDIYWGGESGYSRSRRTVLPTVGVHLDAMVDAGNVYHRRYQWEYEFEPVLAPQDASFAGLKWDVTTDFGTSAEFQVRTAAGKDQLAAAGWQGPDGKGSYYQQSPARVNAVPHSHRWLQYRVRLTSQDGANSAYLNEVAVECVRQ